MKKIIAVILCLTMLVPFGMTSAFASSAEGFAEDENSLIVFVTGIGQSWSYLFDDKYLQEDAFESGTLQDYENYSALIAEGKFEARWNLFNDIGRNIKEKDTLLAAARLVLKLLSSTVTRKNTITDEEVDTLVRQLFKYNLVDENGNCDPHVVTPRYTVPLSEYPGTVDEDGNTTSHAKERFYSSIPCKDIAREKLGENFEDYIYCYNYSAFSYTSKNVDGLHTFIETILENNKVGAKKVVLVPMSMGASVVSAYLYKYPLPEDNHVRRVVSIVGCWQGSDVVYDLVTQNYADNSDELFYNGLIAELVGEPWGYLVNGILRLFPKDGLRDFIDQALSSISENILFGAPSLSALVPNEHYEEVRDLIKSDAVRAEADDYHNAQVTLQTRLRALQKAGVTFSFISGYGLPYGAITTDYKAFGFMNHAAKTNSDEIINIDSTAPGTEYVPFDQVFEDTDGRELSPDRSIDIANTWYKTSSWFFEGQKHELEYNNTAIGLAIELALGNIKTVYDCDNLEEDGYYYPQFNGARNIKALKNEYMPALKKYCLENDCTLTEDQQAVYDKTVAMMNSTVNDYENDNAVIEEFYMMLVDLGIYGKPSEKSVFGEFITNAMKKSNDIAYRLFGAKGYLDVQSGNSGERN